MAGVSEVDCRDKERVGLLRQVANAMGYEMSVTVTSGHGGSVALLWDHELIVESTESLANGRVLHGRLLSPAGPILLVSVYGITGGTARHSNHFAR